MPKPVLQALILADQVYRDAGTGKGIIAGTFNQVFSDGFPAIHAGPCWIFLSLTDVRERIQIELQFRYLPTNEVVLRMQGIQLATDDPRQTVEHSMSIVGLPLPEEGVYSFDAIYEDDILGSARLTAIKNPPGVKK